MTIVSSQTTSKICNVSPSSKSKAKAPRVAREVSAPQNLHK